MKAPWQTMTVGDWLVILALLGASLLGILAVASAPVGARVVVMAEGDVRFSSPLDQYQEFDVSGPLGPTRLKIDESGVRVLTSPCPRKICMSMGPAKDAADLIACVPNQILVSIEGSNSHKEDSYDLLSR